MTMATPTVLTDATREPTADHAPRAQRPRTLPYHPGPPAITVAHLTKSYPNGVLALDDITLTVPQGQIFGLLGPNGAGKSTLLRILCGVTTPSSGLALVCGLDPSTRPREVKEHLSGLLQGSPMEPNVRVDEVLWLFSKFYREPLDPDTLLARLGLTDVRRQMCKTLSGGQQQRLAIARALIGNPHVLILDEPSTGLDLAARRELMDIITQLRTEGRSIVISTHNIEEAEGWCDQVAIVSRGRLFAVDTPFAIIDRYGAGDRLEIQVGRPLALDRVKRLPAVLDARELQGPDGACEQGFLLEGMNAEDMLREVIRVLMEANVPLDGARLIRGGLEGAYLKLTGERIRP